MPLTIHQLRALRLRYGWSQQLASEFCGLKVRTYRHLENGLRRKPLSPREAELMEQAFREAATLCKGEFFSLHNLDERDLTLYVRLTTGWIRKAYRIPCEPKRHTEHAYVHVTHIPTFPRVLDRTIIDLASSRPGGWSGRSYWTVSYADLWTVSYADLLPRDPLLD